MKFHHDLTNEQMEDAVASVANSTPELHICTRDGKFDIAQVSGDGHVVDLEVNKIEKSLMLFLCVYYVFYVGFNRAIFQFMGFFQHAIMCEPYEGKNQIHMLNFQRNLMTKLSQ